MNDLAVKVRDAGPSNLYDENNECRHCGAHVADPHQPDCVVELGITANGERPLLGLLHR